MNIVIPMAGFGGRFRDAGYADPKPLIDVNGQPMIQLAIETLGLPGQYIFIVLRYEQEEWNRRLRCVLEEATPNPIIIIAPGTTEGPACSVLLAREHLNSDEPLIVTNCDQVLRWDSGVFLRELADSRCDGMVVTYYSQSPNNSYIKLGPDGWGSELAEKKVISEHSLNGVHYWAKGRYFVESAEAMIARDIRVNGEFYVAPTYNELIRRGLKIGAYGIPREQHIAIGIPEDLQAYLREQRDENQAD